MIKTLPYSPESVPGTYKRLIVENIKKPEHENAAGLILPTDIGRFCETGKVIGCDGDSTIKQGDIVLYAKIDRTNNEHLDTISINGKKCDVLYENEVWAVNDEPFNRVFIRALSSVSVSEDALIVPDNIVGITQQGVVFRAPKHYTVKPNDSVEYRKTEREMYPTINIDGQNYEVLHESDIFLVNDRVAPYRIVVKVDISAQRIKRNTTETGLIRSQLFLHMLHNMQVAEVVEIGKEARKNFPDLSVGDQAIIHHVVESQPWRLLKKVIGKESGDVVYEYRIINGFEKDSRELFGRIINRKEGIFFPYGNHEFIDWSFDVFGVEEQSPLQLETGLADCHNIEALKSVLDAKKGEGMEKARKKMTGITEVLARTHHINQKEKFDSLELELHEVQKDAWKLGEYLNANHLLSCKVLGENRRVLTTFKELYPINVFGKKFLIANKDFIAAELVADI